MATVTLRGRFAPGDRVELVDGVFPDPMIPDAIQSAYVEDDGSVTFGDLAAGREYVVRDYGRTRQARVTPRAEQPPETSLVQPDPLTPVDDPPPAVVEDVPRVVHEGPRHSRMLTSTRGDAFAGEGQGNEGRLTDPKDIADYGSVRQADYAGQQESDTPTGEARPVVVEEVPVERRHHDEPDPVSHERSSAWPAKGKELQARAATREELEADAKIAKTPTARAAGENRTGPPAKRTPPSKVKKAVKKTTRGKSKSGGK